MRYLLDVNVLIALGLVQHEFHPRAAKWVLSLPADEAELATCSVTEMAFVRLLAQVPQYGFKISDACGLLRQVKQTSRLPFALISDGHGCSHLPSWVQTAKQVTDGHLASLAAANGAVLATFDARIRDAFVIPERGPGI